MDIILLRTFMEVARTRHFGQAAERLCVTQSAVSARIKLLESTLGVDLFARQRNNIHLTPAGHRLLRHAESIVRSWSRACQEVALDPQGGHTLTVGCQLDLWPIRVRDWAMHLRQSAPDLVLQLEILPPEALVQRLLAGQLDLALLFEPPRGESLELIQIASLTLVLAATRAGLSTEQAMSSGYVLVDWGSAFAIAHSERFPELAPASARVSQALLGRDLLRASGGAAYLPQALIADDLAAERLHRVADAPVFERAAFAAYRPAPPEGSLLTAVLTSLRAEDRLPARSGRSPDAV